MTPVRGVKEVGWLVLESVKFQHLLTDTQVYADSHPKSKKNMFLNLRGSLMDPHEVLKLMWTYFFQVVCSPGAFQHLCNRTVICL